MTTKQSQKVFRKTLFGGVASVIFLVALEAIGYGMVNLISGIPTHMQVPFLYWIGGFSILIAFGFGMIINSLFVKNWDTWIDDLGSTQVAMLISMLEKRRDILEEEEG
jgi:hypothetical protein